MTREAFVISDLHLGAGHPDPLEDFRHDDTLVSFVDEITHPESTLIINGDFIDFAQIEPLDVSSTPRELLWDEPSSLTKLSTAIAGHSSCFEALGRFVGGGGTLRLVIGNHDLDLAWPKVQDHIRTSIGGTADTVQFVIGATVYDGVHVEHGYQFSPENCPKDPESFIRQWNGAEYLERVWGTDFLLRFFNQLEQDHHYIDNVKPSARIAYHGLRKGWIPKIEIVRLALFLKGGFPLKALGAVLDEKAVDEGSVIDAFAEEHWQQLAADLVADAADEIREGLDELTPEERQALAARQPDDVGEEDIMDDEAEVLGLLRRSSREERAAEDRLKAQGITHVVFGHTHRIVDGNDKGTSHFNPGCWIPHLDVRSDYVKAKIKQDGWVLEMFDDPAMYVVDPRAVHVRPTPTRSMVELISAI